MRSEGAGAVIEATRSAECEFASAHTVSVLSRRERIDNLRMCEIILGNFRATPRDKSAGDEKGVREADSTVTYAFSRNRVCRAFERVYPLTPISPFTRKSGAPRAAAEGTIRVLTGNLLSLEPSPRAQSTDRSRQFRRSTGNLRMDRNERRTKANQSESLPRRQVMRRSRKKVGQYRRLKGLKNRPQQTLGGCVRRSGNPGLPR